MDHQQSEIAILRALPTAGQLETWARWVAEAERSIAAGLRPGEITGVLLAIDAERSALWALVDELAGRVVDWDDDLGDHYRFCGDCHAQWAIDEPEEHCPGCLTGRARALRKAAGRE